MRYIQDRCCVCGNPARPTSLQTKYACFDLTGKYWDTWFWFCSEQCYERALDEYMPPRYAFSKDPLDDPDNRELIDNLWNPADGIHVEEAREYVKKHLWEWMDIRDNHAIAAATKLYRRTMAEYHKQLAEKEEKERIEQEKLAEKQRVEQEKLAEKQRKLDADAEARWLAEEAQAQMLKPKPIPEKIRFQHTHILAPSGFGKTTLLQNNILADFLTPDNKINPNPPAYIIIDPKGLMVERLSRL